MLVDIVLTIGVSVLFLVFSTVAFVDGVEVLSTRLRLTRFATGALLAAVLTALPETIIAILSPFQGGSSPTMVGMGSVLAAPSITVLLGAPVVAVFWRSGEVHRGVAKNYGYFTVFMVSAVVLSQFTLGPLKYAAGLIFLMLFVYLAKTVYDEAGELMDVDRSSLLERFVRREKTVFAFLQVGLAAVGLLMGADLFIDAVSKSVNPFYLALLVSPFATCIEEVLVAFYWMLRNKADISISLLSGENLVQSTFVVGIGMVFTEWRLPPNSLIIVALYGLAAAIIATALVKRKIRFASAAVTLYPLYVLAAA